ncbi:uncharacterized protein LOC114463168 [Gouania willdenowi]|uniref:uncharacterized protein LOC114463168 n=1 Tax=Gouania willdenowi TaxID=441366 RepID=UPI001054288F|nr:uncharacterized protein LOC114463168 [Gouania willdenowi]
MARYCRRATRGTELTERYLDDVLDAFKDATDTMGVPLLDADRVEPIWATQRCHVCCIQDPPHVPLYLQTGQVTMGGVSLPVYRCARGSTSLESFHLHRFIPGTSANDIHFQLYLLEGLTRWNADRSRATVQRGSRGPHLCYSPREMEHANQLSVELFGQRMLDAYSDPSRPYTGELIGVGYLFAQTGQVLEDIPEDTEGPQDEQQVDVIEEGEEEEGQDVDEGFQDLMFYLEGLLQNPVPQPPASTAQPQTEEVYVGDDGTPGYQHVVGLAERLVQLRLLNCVSQRQAEEKVQLWQRLPERDKAPLVFPPRFRDQLTHGRFKKPKSSRAPTDLRAVVESLRRCLSSQWSGPAQSPGVSCLVETISILLCKIFPLNRTISGVRISRWSDIVCNYGFIRENVLSHPMLSTKLQLFQINQKTLTQWFNKRKARQENVVLCVGQMDNIPPLTACSTEDGCAFSPHSNCPCPYTTHGHQCFPCCHRNSNPSSSSISTSTISTSYSAASATATTSVWTSDTEATKNHCVEAETVGPKKRGG